MSKANVRVPQLTRDKCVPRNDQETCITVSHALTNALLVAKLHSEAEEIALDMRNVEEYADLFETLIALAALNGIAPHHIFVAARKKTEAKGGLIDGNFWVPIQYMENSNGS